MPDPLTIETLQGAAILPHRATLAALRITVFRDWPYLYDGDGAYEQTYLATYAASATAAIIIARDRHTIVGAATCLPLRHEPESIQAPFRNAGFDPATLHYFGESVLLEPWRGRGTGVAFFAAREAQARAAHATHAAFCAVIRDPDDPRRPPGAIPLDDFWRRRGFSPHPDLICRMRWRELGAGEVENRLQVWLKPLQALP